MTDPNDAERYQREMQQFLYAVSHDLQEPLRKISTFGKRLAVKLGDDLDDAARADLDRVLSAAERGQGMIEGLLVLSRIATAEAEFADVDLNQTLAEVTEELYETITAAGAVVRVETLPTVHGNADQLKLLFSCLIDNGIKFRRPDTDAIIRVFRENAAGTKCRLVVEDNGIGLNPRYADRIFTVFQRLHPRDVYPGPGLGLAFCRKIAERHGGLIKIESVPDAGARFVVALPAGE